MEIVVQQSLYPPESVILAVQKYLTDFEVNITKKGQNLTVSIAPKKPGVTPPSEAEFENHLVQSAFRCQHERDTAELRRLLLDRAFGQYR